MNLTDFERKLLIILSHHNKKGQLTNLKELQIRTGREEIEIKNTINILLEKGFLKKGEKGLIVTIALF